MEFNFREYFEKLKKSFRQTSLEIFLGIFLGATLTGYTFYNREIERTKTIPLGFSEISQIEKDARNREEIGSMTKYLAYSNDAVMKIFECWNKSNESEDTLKIFASELEMIIDPAFKFHHYDLTDLILLSVDQSREALKELKDFIFVMNKISNTNEHFSAAWSDSHMDYYRTEIHVNNKGETYTETVYDHTVHSYDYNKVAGEEASKSLDKTIGEHKVLRFNEEIKQTRKTNAEGEYVAEQSRGLVADRLTPAELLEISNRWRTGSTLNTNLPVIYNMWGLLHSDADSWRKAKNTARSAHYTTYSHYDSGPQEFQVASTALKHGRTLYSSINEIIQGIAYAQQNAPVLYKKVNEFIGVVLDNKAGDANKLSKEILGISKHLYKLNFKNGFDVTRLRWYMVMLGGFMGAAVGGGIGKGFDYMGEKRWYKKS